VKTVPTGVLAGPVPHALHSGHGSDAHNVTAGRSSGKEKIMLGMVAALAVILVSWPLVVEAQDGRAALERVAQAMGAAGVKSIEYSGTGDSFSVGQSVTPGKPWPRFTLKSYTQSANYETASLRRDQVVVRVDVRGGGLPAMGEARQIVVVSGDHAWTVVGDAPSPQPRFRTEQQLQLWATPHGVVKAAMANNATVKGRTFAFTVPGRFTARATVDDQDLVTRVEAVYSNQVVGDMPVEVTYSDYRDFEGVKFPMKIKQSTGGFPALDLTVSEVRPNAIVDIAVPDSVRQNPNPFAKVTSQAVAEGVWYVTGGSHHSVAIEMKDHVIVVEAPLDDSRALAVIGEVRGLVPAKPIRYVVNSHQHFDHAGGLRAFAGEGVTVITHETNRAFLEGALAAPAQVSPDHLAKSGRKGTVEGVKDKRVLTDGTRTVEIHHMPASPHEDGMLMVYLPTEKLLSQADAFTPGPPDSPPPAVVNPSSVNLSENIRRLNLAVDRLLPLHGRMVPLADLHRAIGQSQ
jgi:glyoxylase-like metal-dependent hydrolase (beta-lactamase superfamily II)